MRLWTDQFLGQSECGPEFINTTLTVLYDARASRTFETASTLSAILFLTITFFI